ncbi:urease accessory protein UreD [Nocardia bhagyanarayanae]|uniref:Urease accessory protein n=1 Tax=Nocardia bhagyanarayanae TaxID=1215925 RepID=A0A543FHQ6_9NOCA|nr:urease accessory protein UreD [Nocardia bhagyanarayanae]TQM33387.1 urease accessory protein [Nocardia bhagyanarayanae]
MRTDLRIVAAAGTLPEIHASGGLAARRTGQHTVHLIGTAATPLGGDELHISVTVGPGARLALRSVAATIALPGVTTRISFARWVFEVAEGGELDVETEPLIVAGGADHRAVTTARLAADARLRLRERVQIGRAGEDIGLWRGDLIADLDDLPLLRHRLELGSGTATDDALSAPRALDSELVYPDDRPVETLGPHATRLPLAAGGSLFTAVGSRLATTASPRTPRGAVVSVPATA